MNSKIAQTIIIIIIIITQNSWNFIVGRSSLLKKWQTSVIIREISDSNLETGRYGPKFVVSLDYPGELTALYFLLPVLLLHLHMSFFLLTVYLFMFYYQKGIFLYSFTNLFTTNSKLCLHFFFISDWHPHFSLSRTLFVCFHWSSVCISGHKINSTVKSCY